MKPLDEEVREQEQQAGGEAQPTAGDTQQENVETAGEEVVHDLDELQRKARERDEFLALLQRARADFANYQQRVTREMEEQKKYAIATFVRDLLTVVDDLERAIEAAECAPQAGAIAEGVRLVYRQLQNVFERYGIRPIVPDGETFDPKYHEAVGEEERTDMPSGKVVRTLQKGYLLHDRLIRPAKVIVSRAVAPPEEQPQGSGEEA